MGLSVRFILLLISAMNISVTECGKVTSNNILDSESDGQPQIIEDLLISANNMGPSPGEGGVPPHMHTIGSEEEEEIVEVELLETGSDSWILKFESHGRLHKLDLEKSRSIDLSDVSIQILGMSDGKQKIVMEKLKNITFAHDKARGASMALHLPGNTSTPCIKGGVFKLGDHHFEVAAHVKDDGKVKVKRSFRGYSFYQQLNDNGRIIKESDIHPKEKRSVTPTPEKKIREKITIDPLSATIELLLVLDYGLWSGFELPDAVGDETDKAVDLVVAYTHVVNMVDRSYRNIRNNDLQIHVKLVGMLVLSSPDMLPEISEKNKYFDILSQAYIIENRRLLKGIEDWFASEANDIPPHDHLTYITGYSLFNRAGFALGGTAYVDTMCNRGLFQSVVAKDIMALTMVADAIAHEIGHNLGALHDSAAYGCPSSNYIMNNGFHPLNQLENKVLFSCCTQRVFYDRILRNAPCLFEESSTEQLNSTIDDIVSNTTLGEVYDADDQCYMSLGMWACGDWVYEMYNVSVCRSLWCDDGSACLSIGPRALDGTYCGEDMWCIEGQCVSQNSSTAKLKDHSCDVSECYIDEFRCKAGYNTNKAGRSFCIPQRKVCDGAPDCSDSSDETECDLDPPLGCNDGFTACSDRLSHNLTVPVYTPHFCLYDAWVCDSQIDCVDGSDEDNCTNTMRTAKLVQSNQVVRGVNFTSSSGALVPLRSLGSARSYNGATTTTTPEPTAVCGGDMVRDSGPLVSPNYPNKYPHDSNCTWRISSTDENQIIVLTFPLVRIESYNDWIAIYDGYSDFLIRVLTGPIYETTVVKGLSNSVMIQFYSDHVTSASAGWRMTWTSDQDYEVNTQMSVYDTNDPFYIKPFCLGIHTGITGELTSPNYPREYYTGLRCRYDITVPSGIISLRVNHLDLEPQTDYLYVYDMSTDTLLRSLTGLVRNNTVIESKSSSMRLMFISSLQVKRPGFNVTWFISRCEAHGNTYRSVPDTECTKFTQTVHSLGIGPFQFDCPAGTAFDSSLCTCSHKSAFSCPI